MPEPDPLPARTHRAVQEVAQSLSEQLESLVGRQLLMAFLPTSFFLVLRGSGRRDIERFLAYARRVPRHPVGMRRIRGGEHAGTWELFPRDAHGEYRLTFTLPDHVETWIANAEDARAAIRTLKTDLLPSMQIHYMGDEGIPHVFQLEYAPRELRP